MHNHRPAAFRHKLCLAVLLALGMGVVGHAQDAPPALLGQADGVPAEFLDHFFGVPLAAHVELDGRPLGEALLVLGRDERVQLLEFTEVAGSAYTPLERQRWMDALAEPKPLGNCTRDCGNDLVALHYSLGLSQLSILTGKAELSGERARFHALPEEGSRGLILRNRLNLSGGERDLHGSYQGSALASLGNWTGVAEGQFDRTNYGGVPQDYYRLSGLYADRIIDGSFYRLGYFSPSAQGLSRLPRTLSGRSGGVLGLMFGSSDTLAIDDGQASSTPIYVTPNRPGIVEVYRDGSLIYSQAVQPGLQTLDTRRLPGGIYSVEVRVIEDGQITSRSEEFIYKPGNWKNPEQNWRYNAYLGQRDDLLSNSDSSAATSLDGGVIANYLLHPRLVTGLSVEHVGTAMQYGTSLDWDARQDLRLYGNLYHTENRGNGFDFQSVYNYDGGSLTFNHSRAWLESHRELEGVRYRDVRATQQSSLGLSHRVNQASTATARLQHSSGGGNSGVGLDLSWSQRTTLFGSDANWRLSLFDRPGSASSGGERSRGVDLSLTMSLGGEGRHVHGSVGSRTARDGSREYNASLGYQQDVDYGALQSVSGTLNADSYGVGLSAGANLQGRALYGSGYLQTSSYNGELSGGLNLESTVGIGGGAIAVSGNLADHPAALVVDVESDYPDIELQAFDPQGGAASLKPGRNLVPVGAYKTGNVQFDFRHDEAAAAVVQPQTFGYHLNKGGVGYQKIRVMRTFTVIGRLLDAKGQPMRGAMLINHASRSVSEADGFFAVEMSQSTPTLEVRHQGNRKCLLRLEAERYEREGDVLLVGDQRCAETSLADIGRAEGRDS